MNGKAVDLIHNLDCITIFMDKKYGNLFENFRLKSVKEQIVLAKRDSSLSEDWKGYVNIDTYPPLLCLLVLNGDLLTPIVKLKIPLENEVISIETPYIGKIRIEFKFHQKKQRDRCTREKIEERI